MADTVDVATRSRMMSGIRGQNTKGEVFLRKGLHARGLRYRINVRGLPGTPDIVLPRHHVVLFFNGCFWHQHDCHLFRWPKTRENFWREKLRKNRERDWQIRGQLAVGGWRVGIVWECGLKAARNDPAALLDEIEAWIRTGPFKPTGSAGKNNNSAAAQAADGDDMGEQYLKEWRA